MWLSVIIRCGTEEKTPPPKHNSKQCKCAAQRWICHRHKQYENIPREYREHPSSLCFSDRALRSRKCRNRKRCAFGEFSNYFLNRFPDEFCVGDKPKEIWLAAKLKFKEWNVARYESNLPLSFCSQSLILLNGSRFVFHCVIFIRTQIFKYIITYKVFF